MSETTCETCRWWDRRDPSHTYADCRRLPPRNTLSVSGREIGGGRVQVTLDTHANASWPNTAANDWCGEHAPQEAARDDR